MPPNRAAGGRAGHADGVGQTDAAARANTFDRPGRDEPPDFGAPRREPTVIEWD